MTQPALEVVEFSGIPILRPASWVEGRVYERIKLGVFSKFKPGHYQGASLVNEVVLHLYHLYECLIDEQLQVLDGLELSIHLCGQYEQYARVEQAYKNGQLRTDEERK